MQKNRKNARKKSYFGSEVMAEDIIEGICDRVAKTSMGRQLLKKSGQADVTLEESKTTRDSLENYCQGLIEEHEDDIKENLFNIKQVKKMSKWLCADREKVCEADYFKDSTGPEDASVT